MTMMVAILLAQAAASIPSSTPVAINSDRSQRIVCHNEEITGSLANHRRICRTVSEWQQLHDNSVGTGNDLVDHSLIVAGNGH